MSCLPTDSSQFNPRKRGKKQRRTVGWTELSERLDYLLDQIDSYKRTLKIGLKSNSPTLPFNDERNYTDPFKDYWPLRKDSSVCHAISTDRHKHHCCCCHQRNIKTRTSKHQGVSYPSQLSFHSEMLSNNTGTDNLKMKLNSIHPRVHCHSNLSVKTSLTDDSMMPNKVNSYKQGVDFAYGRKSPDQLSLEEALSRPIQNITKGDVVDIITHVVKLLCETENSKYRENLADWKCILKRLQGIRPNRKTNGKEKLEGKQSFDVSSFTTSLKDITVDENKMNFTDTEKISTPSESYSYHPHYPSGKRLGNETFSDIMDSLWNPDFETDNLKQKCRDNYNKFSM